MYQNFIGIDIGKFDFFVGAYNGEQVTQYPNNLEGFTKLLSDHQKILPQSLVVLETTGGYEKALIRFLQCRNIAVHRANTRKVKHFIRSYGQLGKSDAIDSLALASYGHERHASLPLYAENKGENLRQLVRRRRDLKHMIVQEKNRCQAPDQALLAESYKKVICILEIEIQHIDASIDKIFQEDKLFDAKKNVLTTITGIGDITATELLALVPELGMANRKQIASLCGLAPHPNESGRWIGKRFVRGGRTEVKAALFMAAMSAARSKSRLGSFYKKMVDSGKNKMVALTALMRKILVIANARMRDFYANQPLASHS